MSLDFKTYINEKTEHFTGREWVFQAINDWLSQKDATRNFILTGDPGSGKSAIAARLVQFSLGTAAPQDTMSCIVPDFLSAVHFCSSHDLRWINPHVFAQSLALQLASRYPVFAKALAEKSGDRQIIMEVDQEVQEVNGGQVIGIVIKKLDVGAINPQDAFIRVVREPLEVLLNQGTEKQVLILVDSLDESLHYSGTDTIATLLGKAENLPVGVNFILTSRLEKDVLRPFSLNSAECSLTSVKGLSQSRNDIKKYVDLTLAEYPVLKEKLSSEMSQEEFMAAILDKSEGNFLYVKFLLEMLKTRQEEISQKSLNELPNGLDGIYIEFIDRLVIKDLDAWPSKYGPVLGTLSVAKSPLTEAQIAAFVKRDKAEVRILLQKLRQLLDTDESMPASQRVYSAYHRSFADFLLNEDRAEEYWCEDIIQHERIVRYYLDTFLTSWTHCDSYGLSQLCNHLQFLVTHTQKKSDQDKYANDLFQVVTDESFRYSQINMTGDPLIIYTCLNTALENSLKRDELVAMLVCLSAIRDTKRNTSLTKTIFDAVAAGNFEHASQRGQIFWGDEWARLLNLYIVWEAAESGNQNAAEISLKRLGDKNLLQLSSMGDALLVRIARLLSQKAKGFPDARTLLERLGRGEDADQLLGKYSIARELEQSVILEKLQNIEQYLSYMEQTISEGAVEGISLDSELAGSFSENLQHQLTCIAADVSGQSAIDRALTSVLGNPYPQYRDIALISIGTAIVSAPDPLWVRERLQQIFITTIEREGVTFTFDLPSILISEAKRRNLKANELELYLEKALSTEDRWGTMARAMSARAAALFYEGDVDSAFEELWKAGQMNIGMAGYSTVTLLSFADRCYEFGQPEKAISPIWGSNKDVSLLDGARGVAEKVRDIKFRNERKRLVEDYCRAFNADHGACYSFVFGSIFHDLERDKALISLLSARNSSPPDNPKWEALKSLLPLVLDTLGDSTVLDAVIARIIRLRINRLNDSEVTEAISVCSKYLTTGRPWEFGKWDQRSLA